MLNFVVDKNIPFISGVLEPYANVGYFDAKDITAAAVMAADALLIRTRTRCNAALLQNSRVKFMATATIGSDHIDADFCQKNNIAWANAAGCNAGAVEQYVMTALLTLAHQKGMSLCGKTMGVVGVGNVGKRVAATAERLGMHLLLCDQPRAQNEPNAHFVSLYEVAANADVITFHVPLALSGKDATYHLAGHDFFAQVGKKPIFINTSRGEVVDEECLRAAVVQQKIAAVALDVWENEPHISTATLDLANIGTPHIAGYSAEGKAKASQMAVRAMARFFDLPLQTWQPQALPPLPLHNLCSPAADLQNALYRVYSQSYDIWADDAALRLHPHNGEELRNRYVLRREPQVCWLLPTKKALRDDVKPCESITCKTAPQQGLEPWTP
ncbi:erythronate-4-phosphate dehydrogenase [Bacteroidia bacterium]|nr:erythronate-4-phosphate dehydrogenase [Bacteroidia bacterium]